MIQKENALLGIRALALVGIVLLVGLVPESRAYQEAIILGNSLSADSSYRAAIDAYRVAHAMRPHTLLPRLSEAQVDLMLGRPGDALALYRRLAAEKGPRPDVLIGWGQAYYSLQDSERALPLWQQALEVGATDAHHYLGMAHLSRGDWSEAANNFVKSLSANDSGKHAQAASYWLGILRALHSPAVAGEYLEMASQGPDEALAANAETLIRALDQPGQLPQAHLTQLGATLFGLGHWRLAQAALENALDDSPKDVEALAYLGATLHQQGDDEGAESFLREALSLDPDHMPSLYFWGRNQMDNDASLPAREAFARLLALDPRNAGACVEIGRTYAVEGKYKLAEEWFEAAIELVPDQPDFLMILVEFESETLFDLDKGLDAAHKATEIDPDDPAVYDSLGWILYLSGQWTEAESALHRAVTLEPNMTGAYYHLGKLYRSQRRFELARWAFGRAVDLGVGSPAQSLAEDSLRLLGDGPETSPLSSQPDRNATE